MIAYEKCGAGLILLAMLASCGPVMEATRPDPVNLLKFKPGEPRLDVLAEIGSPTSSITDAGHACDIYKLYTRGPGAVGKGVLAAGEVVGDIFTLGLSEVIFTPVEGATRNSKHTVLFCYGADNNLLSVTASKTNVDG